MMTTEITTLEVTARTGTGKGNARALRRTGFVPAILYGNKLPPVSIMLKPQLINTEMNKPGFFTRMFDLVLEGTEGTKVRAICRELQRHPVSDSILHVDFQRIGIDSLLQIAVPLHVINESDSPGVKRGGIVNLVEHTVEIVARPDSIPVSLDIDIAGMKIGDSLHLRQILLPAGIRLLHPDPDMTIVTIVSPSRRMETDSNTPQSEGTAS